MIFFKFLPLLASVFSVDTYPPALTCMLESHFERELGSAFILTPISTHGATRTYYYLLTVSDQRFFVKYGEKVDLEIANQTRLSASLPIPPVAPGTSLEGKILVRPFLAHPNYGFNLVDDLYTSIVSTSQFIEVQKKVFERSFLLYGQPTPVRIPSKFFVQRIGERLAAILNDPKVDDYLKQADIPVSLMNRELFHRRILYHSQTQDTIELPSICDMIFDFQQRFTTVPTLKGGYRIHGDMHPPNIALHDPNGIVFIDLSDICENEDPCWDLGKWLNHVKRLHPVVQKRELAATDEEIVMEIDEDRIHLADYTFYPQDRNQIGFEGIKMFAHFLEEPIELIELRSKGAEFVVNVNTLKRHMELFPVMTKRILCLIVESYLEWTRAFDAYIIKDTSTQQGL